MSKKKNRKNSNYTKEPIQKKDTISSSKTIYRLGALVLAGALIISMLAMYGFRF